MATLPEPIADHDHAADGSPESAVAFWAALQHHDTRFTASESEALYNVYCRGLAELSIIRRYAAESQAWHE